MTAPETIPSASPINEHRAKVVLSSSAFSCFVLYVFLLFLLFNEGHRHCLPIFSRVCRSRIRRLERLLNPVSGTKEAQLELCPLLNGKTPGLTVAREAPRCRTDTWGSVLLQENNCLIFASNLQHDRIHDKFLHTDYRPKIDVLLVIIN